MIFIICIWYHLQLTLRREIHFPHIRSCRVDVAKLQPVRDYAGIQSQFQLRRERTVRKQG